MSDFLERHADKWEPCPATGCYLWTGAYRGRLSKNNGVTRINSYAEAWDGSRNVTVSRKVCEEKNGPPPTSTHQASHICGVSMCVNPDHLLWETPSQNMARMDPALRKIFGYRGGTATKKATERGKELRGHNNITVPFYPTLDEYGTYYKEFITGMVLKLHKNSHKDTPNKTDIEGMIKLMEAEITELREQLSEDKYDTNSLMETFDVANFALLIFIALRREGVGK
jgi:hypothetical protein